MSQQFQHPHLQPTHDSPSSPLNIQQTSHIFPWPVPSNASVVPSSLYELHTLIPTHVGDQFWRVCHRKLHRVFSNPGREMGDGFSDSWLFESPLPITFHPQFLHPTSERVLYPTAFC